MDKSTLQERLLAIDRRAQMETEALFLEVLNARQYPDDTRLRRIRHNEDGTIYDNITGTVVGAGVFLYSGINDKGVYPNVQYWVRVEMPEDYNSHQQCNKYGLELGKAEDFWEGDTRWTLIKEP